MSVSEAYIGTAWSHRGTDFSVGNVFSRAWEVFARNFPAFFLIAFIAALPNLLMVHTGTASGAASSRIFLGALLTFVLSPIAQAAIVYSVFQDLRGESFRMEASLRTGFRRFWPIIGLSILTGLGVGLGCVLLIVPGLVLLATWYVALPACVVESLGPVDSLRRSASLTEGHRWKVFGMILLLFAIAAAATGPIELILQPVSPLAAAMGKAIMTGAFAAYCNSVLAIMYHDLRVAKEGIDTGQVAAVFE